MRSISFRRFEAGSRASLRLYAALALASAACAADGEGSTTQPKAPLVPTAAAATAAPTAAPAPSATDAASAAPSATAGAAAPSPAAVSGMPPDLNVLMISIDSLRADMPWAGYPRDIAPVLTAFEK